MRANLNLEDLVEKARKLAGIEEEIPEPGKK